MNSQIIPRWIRRSLGAGLLLCSVGVASATTLVTFQVDMSLAAFDPATQTVAARGSFNGWAAFPLTNNPSGANPGLWSGTTNLPDNGVVISYKYSIEPGGTYESVASGGSHNRLATLPSGTSATLLLPKVFFNDGSSTTTEVTFQVDMAQQINNRAFIPGTSSVYARGFFNGWSTDVVMTNDPTILRTNQNGLVTSNVYVSVYDITGSPGQTIDYKYYFDTGSTWESPAPNSGDPADNNNRFFNLAQTGPQKLPTVFFNDAPYAPIITVDVTFQVDMSSQVLDGSFDPASGYVEVRGNFNSWGPTSGPQILCTNDPTALNTNVYKAVVRFTDGVATPEQYKFWSTVSLNGGWEQGNNRNMYLANASTQVLPLVNFNNVDPHDLLPAETVVTYRVNMAGAVGTDAHVFDPANDSLYVNGLPGGTFLTWDGTLPQLTNNPVGSSTYSIQYTLPKGSPVKQTYKYGINAADNEAGAGSNHVRYVRSTGTYVMPLDTFGSGMAAPEQSFGDFKVSPSTSAHVLLTWLGRPGVHLQTTTNLSGGTWVDHLETDGLSSTNWPASTSHQYFRLILPHL